MYTSSWYGTDANEVEEISSHVFEYFLLIQGKLYDRHYAEYTRVMGSTVIMILLQSKAIEGIYLQ